MPPALQSLRRQLREKFPDAHQERVVESCALAPTLPAFPKGALSELSPAGPASGLSLVLAQLLDPQDPKSHIQDPTSKIADPGSPIADRKPKPRVVTNTPTDRGSPIALIDGRDSFDPASYGPAACSRLLWIRCRHAAESLRCADLLLRDGNLPLLTLDLQLNPLRELQDIPAASWYRLRNLARQSDSTLLAFTPRPLIPCAGLQLTFPSSFSLEDLEQESEFRNQKSGIRMSENRRSGS